MRFLAKCSVAIRKPAVRMIPKPTPVTLIGPGRRREIPLLLRSAGAERPFFLVSRTLRGKGILDGLFRAAEADGARPVIRDGVSRDPTFREAEMFRAAAAGCDAVVGIGGGSTLDTAKLVAAGLADPGRPLERLTGALRVRRRPRFLILAPTTAGTGSETTLAAVISDSRTHRKKQILDPNLVPFAAVLDPELTTSLPGPLTAATAMDALTHALEAYVSVYATEESDRCAEIAVRLLTRFLPAALEDPENPEARERLLLGSFMAGKAFTRVYVGYVHAFAHAVGGLYGVPHGMANAVLLPLVMKRYLPAAEARLARLGRLLSLGGSSDRETAERFVGFLSDFRTASGLPDRLDAFPPEGIPEVIREAFRECHGIYPVPRYFGKRESAELLKEAAAR